MFFLEATNTTVNKESDKTWYVCYLKRFIKYLYFIV